MTNSCPLKSQIRHVRAMRRRASPDRVSVKIAATSSIEKVKKLAALLLLTVTLSARADNIDEIRADHEKECAEMRANGIKNLRSQALETDRMIEPVSLKESVALRKALTSAMDAKDKPAADIVRTHPKIWASWVHDRNAEFISRLVELEREILPTNTAQTRVFHAVLSIRDIAMMEETAHGYFDRDEERDRPVVSLEKQGVVNGFVIEALSTLTTYIRCQLDTLKPR